MTRSTLLLIPALSQVLAFPLTTLRSPPAVTGRKAVFSPLVAKPEDPGLEDQDELYDPEEFLDNVNITATILNGRVTPNRPTDPLASMENLTQKLRSLSSQFEYQLSIAKDDRGHLQHDLQQSQADREKLQAVISELRRDKENLVQTLNETQSLHQQEQDESIQQIKTLQASLSKHKRALQGEQQQTKKLRDTVSTQQQQLQKVESSSRHLLMLLWKLLQRRILNWIVFIFPILYRMFQSVMGFFASSDKDETPSSEQTSASASSSSSVAS